MQEDLAARVAKLEADYHRLAAADTFSGQSFELVNDDGDTVGSFRINEDGAPCLTLADKHGETRLIIQLQDGRPSIIFCDQDSNGQLSLGEYIEGDLGLVMVGQYRRNRVLLGVSRKGEPYLQLAGTNGTVELDTALPPGWLGLSLVDEGHRNRLAVALDPLDHNGSPFIVLTDHRDRQHWWRGS